MKILSFGAGMQSTALALMACENVDAERKGRKRPYPLVPVYDLVIFCDLGFEPPWVMEQAEFVHRSCDVAGIRYEMLAAVQGFHDELRRAQDGQHPVVDAAG